MPRAYEFQSRDAFTPSPTGPAIGRGAPEKPHAPRYAKTLWRKVRKAKGAR